MTTSRRISIKKEDKVLLPLWLEMTEHLKDVYAEVIESKDLKIQELEHLIGKHKKLCVNTETKTLFDDELKLITEYKQIFERVIKKI